VTIDATTLAAYAGTYTFYSTSSRDMQVPREFGGLGLNVAIEQGIVKVKSPIPGMPAAKAGIMAGDIITHLDDAATQGLSLGQAIEKIRGTRQHPGSSKDRTQGAGRADRTVARPRPESDLKDSPIFESPTRTASC
jgi:C-terminal processing protease CtpA/Prc